MYGNSLPPSSYDARRSVIGEITQSPVGNVILRVGALWTDDPERGWQQTEHIVLRPMEVTQLVRELAEYLPSRPKPGREAIVWHMDRELAGLVLDKLDGAPVDHERYAQFHERLTEFVKAEEAA